jgi:hypothetical protein
VEAKVIEKLGMNKEKLEEYTLESDKNLRESGVQGGKIMAEHLALGCFIFGVPFLIIGLWALCNMLFGFGFPTNVAIIIGALIIGGYSIYRTKHVKISR